jgi:hypothetical protein
LHSFCFVLSIAYVHLRGRVRHKLTRQLGDHSSFLAPVNSFLYLFSKHPAKPYLPVEAFPELKPLQDHWQEIREEGQQLPCGEIKKSDNYGRRFQLVLQDRLEALPEVVRRKPPVGDGPVPTHHRAAARHRHGQGGHVRHPAAGCQAGAPP